MAMDHTSPPGRAGRLLRYGLTNPHSHPSWHQISPLFFFFLTEEKSEEKWGLGGGGAREVKEFAQGRTTLNDFNKVQTAEPVLFAPRVLSFQATETCSRTQGLVAC